MKKQKKKALQRERAKADTKVKLAKVAVRAEEVASEVEKAKKEFNKGLKLLDDLTKSYKKFFLHTIKVSGSREKAMCLMYSIHHSLACLEMDELNKVWPLDGAAK